MTYPVYFALVVPKDYQEAPVMDRWFHRDPEYLNQLKTEVERKQFEAAAVGDWSRHRNLGWVLNDCIVPALATIDQRLHMDWNTVFEVFQREVCINFNRWLRAYTGFAFEPHPLLILSNRTSVELGATAPDELALQPLLGMNGNEVLLEVAPLLPTMVNWAGTTAPNHKPHEYVHTTLTDEGKQSGRVFALMIGGGGHEAGKHDPFDYDGTHPEYHDLGLGLSGDWTLRALATGYGDPAGILRLGLPPSRMVASSHELLGHGFGVFCHYGDYTGKYPYDFTSIPQFVHHFNQSPLHGNWYGEGQLDELKNANKYHLFPIGKPAPIDLRVDGDVVIPTVNLWPLPEAMRLRWFVDNEPAVDLADIVPLAVVEGQTVRVELWGGVNMHGYTGDKLGEASVTLLPPPPPPAPPAPHVERLVVNPTSVNVRVGDGFCFGAIAQWSDGRMEVVSTRASYDYDLTRISSNGIPCFKARKKGTTQIEVMYGGVSVFVTVNVRRRFF